MRIVASMSDSSANVCTDMQRGVLSLLMHDKDPYIVALKKVTSST